MSEKYENTTESSAKKPAKTQEKVTCFVEFTKKKKMAKDILPVVVRILFLIRTVSSDRSISNSIKKTFGNDFNETSQMCFKLGPMDCHWIKDHRN